MTAVRTLAALLVLNLVLTTSSCVGPAVTLIPTALPDAAAERAYEQSLGAAEGGSYTWTVTEGTLPPGLTLDSRTGILAGTPTADGTHTFTIRAVSAGLPRRTGETTYTLTVISALRVSATLDSARVADAYSDTISISGGLPPYAVQIIGLPAGLDYDRSTGRIFGTPLAAYSNLRLDITVTDSMSTPQSKSRVTTLVIKPPGVEITTETLDPAPIGQAYDFRIEAANGELPYTWAVSGGVLPGDTNDPDHFVLDSASGRITGTARAADTTTTFTVVVQDDDDPASSDAREFKLVIPVALITDSLPGATIGQAYEQALAVGGGLPPNTFTVIAGNLPAGLMLDASTGVIAGTPEADATEQTFTIEITDNDTPATSATQELTIQVSN